MVTVLYMFFQHDVERIQVLYGYTMLHPNLAANMAVFGARFGHPIMTPNPLQFSEVVGCRNPGLSYSKQPPMIKNQHLNKKKPSITEMDKKTCPHGRHGFVGKC